MTNDELRDSLLMAPKNGFARIDEAMRKEIDAYCKRYVAFMDACKTEREATAWAIAEAEKNGFKPFVPGMVANPGDKIYYNNRDKSIALAVVGTASLAEGINVCAAHVDSPRIDIKPNPLYGPLFLWHCMALYTVRTALLSPLPLVRMITILC